MMIDRLRQRLAPVLRTLRSPWALGLIVLFGAIYAFLGYSYSGQQGELNEIRERSAQLAAIAARETSRERVAEAEAQLQLLQADIPPATLMEIDVFRTMRQLAAQMDLDLGTTPELKRTAPTEKVGQTELRVLTFSMTISGEADAVWELVQMLDKGGTPFKTLVLDKTNLLGDSATVDFKIYTMPAQ